MVAVELYVSLLKSHLLHAGATPVFSLMLTSKTKANDDDAS